MVSTVIVLSARHFAEFVTSVVFHELILCLGSFHLQGMFQALSLSLSLSLSHSPSISLSLSHSGEAKFQIFHVHVAYSYSMFNRLTYMSAHFQVQR